MASSGLFFLLRQELLFSCCGCMTRLLTLIASMGRNGNGGIMRVRVTKMARNFGVALLATGLFAGGYISGQNRVGQPKTIIHVVEIQWNPGVPQMEKDAAINGVKEMAAKIPGVKNVWVKAERL